MTDFHVPEHLPRRRNKRLKWFGDFVLKLMGWKICGRLPEKRMKFILPVAPHTSNWDFVIAIAVMFSLEIKVTFLGKDSIFKGFFGRWLVSLGGVPIDRTHPHGVVGQMVERFNSESDMILALAPEGTRSKTKQWKTGFLHIAKQAQVPIIPVALDYKRKQVTFLSSHIVEGDISDELEKIKQLYASCCAKNPHLV